MNPLSGADPGLHPSGRPPAIVVFVLLACIIALGGWIRLQGLDERGPVFFDTASYILEGKWIASTAKLGMESLAVKAREMRTRQDLWSFDEQMASIAARNEGLAPRYARPGDPLLLAIAMALTGSTGAHIGALVSSVTGLLTILVVYFAGRMFFGPWVGLAAAFLLSVSGYHAIYSTQAWADMNAVLFCTLSIVVYARGRDRLPSRPYLYVAASGLLGGLAFTVHDRSSIILLVLWIYEFHLWIRNREMRGGIWWRRFVLLNAAFLAPIIAFELPYYLGMLFFRRFGAVLPFPTYIEELIHHAASGFGRLVIGMGGGLFMTLPEELGSHYCNFYTYPYLWFKYNGPVLTALLVGGCATLLWRRTFADFVLFVWAIVPLVFFSLQLETSSRFAVVSLPALALISARPLERFLNRAGGRSTIALVGTLIVLAAAGFSGVHYARMHIAIGNGYREATTFIGAHGARHISTQVPVSQIYVGVGNVAEPPDTLDELEALFLQGYRYYLVDIHKHAMHAPGRPTAKWELVEKIEAELEPAAVIPNPIGGSLQYAFEVNIFFHQTRKLLRMCEEMEAHVIKIYDLSALFAEAVVGGEPPDLNPS